MNLADEIEKRILAIGQEPDHTEGGILLPWKQRKELELTRFLNDQAANIVDALRTRPEEAGANVREDLYHALRILVSCVERDRTGAGILLPTEAALQSAKELLGRLILPPSMLERVPQTQAEKP